MLLMLSSMLMMSSIPYMTLETLTLFLSMLILLMTKSFTHSWQTISPYSTPSLNLPMLLDMLSTLLIILTLLISTLMILTSPSLTSNTLFPPLIMLLNLFTLLSFMFQNFLAFYILFESTILPTTMLIMIFGYQPERLIASLYLMLYTMVASLPLLMGITLLAPSFNTLLFFAYVSPLHPTFLLNSSLLLAFLTKIPLFLLHNWLPKAHVEAPVTGSMFLAGVLLKLGMYGIMRLMLMHASLTQSTSSFLLSLALGGCVNASLICMRQTDTKTLIAYSSIAHMALALAALMTDSQWGWDGNFMLLLSHGICSALLFNLANSHYELFLSRNIALSTHTHTLMSSFALWWFLSMLCNSGVPPSLNMVSEISVITSLTASTPTSTPMLLISSVLTLLYSILLYVQLHHGWSSESSKFPNSSLSAHGPPPIMLSMLYTVVPTTQIVASV